MDYENAMFSLFQHRFAKDMLSSYKLAEGKEISVFSSLADRVVVPLRAEVYLAYKKGFGDLTLSGRFQDKDSGWINARQCFSTREYRDARDQIDLICHLFDRVKEDLIDYIAKKEFDSILDPNKAKE